MDALSVLVVDDELALAESWAKHLAKLGYQIMEVVTSGEEAIAAVAAFGVRPPDIALIDISLSRSMTGVETAAQIRLWVPAIQIVFCSAYEPAEVAGLQWLPGEFLYLEKPFSLFQLGQAVAQAAAAAVRANTTDQSAQATSWSALHGKNTMSLPTTSNDHDLLVRLDTKLDLLSVQLNEVRVQVAGKADAATLDPRIAKLEQRLESQQRTVYMMLGGLAVLELLLKFLPLLPKVAG
jgi:CheY-like chemotaxis protein